MVRLKYIKYNSFFLFSLSPSLRTFFTKPATSSYVKVLFEISYSTRALEYVLEDVLKVRHVAVHVVHVALGSAILGYSSTRVPLVLEYSEYHNGTRVHSSTMVHVRVLEYSSIAIPWYMY